MKLFDFFIDVGVRTGEARAQLAALDRSTGASRGLLVGLGAAATGSSNRLLALGGAGYAAASGIRALVSAGFEYERGMKGFKALSTDIGERQTGLGMSYPENATSQQIADVNTDEMGRKVREIARDSSKTSAETAAAAEMLARNGVEYKTIFSQGLQSVVLGSEALQVDLQEAANMVTDVKNIFAIPDNQLLEAMNDVAGAARESKFTLTDFWYGVTNAGGAANEFGVELEQMLTLLTMTDEQFKTGREAGTAWKNFFNFASGKSGPAKALLKEHNIEFFDEEGEAKNIREILAMLQDNLAGLSDKEFVDVTTAIWGTRSSRAIRALIDRTRDMNGELKTGAELVAEFDAQLADIDAASVKEMRDIRLEGAEGAFKMMIAAIETAAVAIYDSGLNDALERLFKNIREIAIAVETWVVENPELVKQMSEWAVEAGKVAAAFGAIAAGVGAVALAMGALKLVAKPLLAMLGLGTVGLGKKLTGAAAVAGGAATAGAGKGATAKAVGRGVLAGGLSGLAMNFALPVAAVTAALLWAKDTSERQAARREAIERHDPETRFGETPIPVEIVGPYGGMFNPLTWGQGSVNTIPFELYSKEQLDAYHRHFLSKVDAELSTEQFKADAERVAAGYGQLGMTHPNPEARDFADGLRQPGEPSPAEILQQHTQTILDALPPQKSPQMMGQAISVEDAQVLFTTPVTQQTVQDIRVSNSMVFNVKAVEPQAAAQEIGQYLEGINGGVSLDGAQ